MSKRSKQLSYWAKLNSMWESSGMPQEKFCKEQGVVYNQFVYRRAQILKGDKQIAVKPKLMTVVPPKQTHFSNKPADVVEEPPSLEVELPSGVKFHIKSTSDIAKASALLKQLGGGL